MKTKTMMYRFWLWLREYSNKKVRKHYMLVSNIDLKCPKCHTWISETDGPETLADDLDNPGLVRMQCARCGGSSWWDFDDRRFVEQSTL